jgi:hypothetical protein
MGGLATLIPGQGFKALYSRFEGSVNPLYSAFFQATLAY